MTCELVAGATSLCGDSGIDSSHEESCDDGNGIGADGCSSSCAVEPGWTCSGTPSVCIPACADGIDNDGDNVIDYPSDVGCRNAAFNTEDPECDDGIDNDGDGKKDSTDADCYAPSDRSERVDCSDGIDNDGDLLTDTADPGCFNSTWPYEDPECSDGVDNDEDGKIDWIGADPQCAAPYVFREKPKSGGCGIGAELLGLLILLRAMKRPT